MPHKEHEIKDIDFAVITISDTRNKDTDVSGKIGMELIENAGIEFHYIKS